MIDFHFSVIFLSLLSSLLCFVVLFLCVFPTKRVPFTCFELFLRSVCHSNVMMCVLSSGSGQGRPSRLFCWHCHVYFELWMIPGIRSPSSDLWTSWLTRLGLPHCDSACSDSGLRVPCLSRRVPSSMARFSPACLPSCFLPCRSIETELLTVLWTG